MNDFQEPRRTGFLAQSRAIFANRISGKLRSRSCFLAAWLVGASFCFAQDAPDTAIIDTIRTQTQISDSDQRRIGDWIEAQARDLIETPGPQRAAAAVKLRALFKAQFDNPTNTPAFKEQFAAKTAALAAAQLAGESIEPTSARALAKALVDFNRPETAPAFLAGLKSKDAGVRMLAASGLAAQRAAIAADKTRLDQTVSALREAGIAEEDGVVLDRIYWALSMPPAQLASVFDAFMAIFEKRLERRRAGSVVNDGAEITAYEFFRTPGIVAALSAPQKEKLVSALAVFLRLDAQRYTTPGMTLDENYLEYDRLQRLLDGGEELLVALAPGAKGGDIRGSLAAGNTPDQVLQQAVVWVGDAKSDQAGALNAAPWNVPAGAP